MGTNLLEALDFCWDHNNDWMYLIQYQKLSTSEKISKIINDIVVYLFSSALGVNTLEKIAKKRNSIKKENEYKEYVKSHSYINHHSQSVILILTGEGDIPSSSEGYRQLEEESKCKIQFLKLSKLQDLEEGVESLKGRGNKIKALWLRAHGRPHSISFGHDCELNIGPLTEFEQLFKSNRIENTRIALLELLKKLESDAPVILESCFTGQEMEAGEENIAQFIARTAGGRKIYAPSREALPIDKGISYTSEHGFKVTIKSYQTSTYFSKGSCLGRICAIWHAFRDHEEDITRTFHQ